MPIVRPELGLVRGRCGSVAPRKGWVAHYLRRWGRCGAGAVARQAIAVEKQGAIGLFWRSHAGRPSRRREVGATSHAVIHTAGCTRVRPPPAPRGPSPGLKEMNAGARRGSTRPPSLMHRSAGGPNAAAAFCTRRSPRPSGRHSWRPQIACGPPAARFQRNWHCLWAVRTFFQQRPNATAAAAAHASAVGVDATPRTRQVVAFAGHSISQWTSLDGRILDRAGQFLPLPLHARGRAACHRRPARLTRRPARLTRRPARGVYHRAFTGGRCAT